jgi:hypothetical protein
LCNVINGVRVILKDLNHLGCLREVVPHVLKGCEAFLSRVSESRKKLCGAMSEEQEA